MKKMYFFKTLMLLSFALLWIGNGLKAQNTSFLEFDGDDSFYVNDASNKLDVNGLDWTIELWVYPTTVPASGTYPAILSRKYSFELYFRNTNGNLGFGIIAFDGSGSGFTSEASLNSSTKSMSLNEWHHLAVSSHYSGGTRTTGLYLDGTRLYYSTDPDFSLDASIAAINVGARYDGGYVRYVDDCGMDEIRYSKTARYTSTSFTINTTSAPFTTDNNTILLYHLNENTGTSIANDNDHDFDASLRSSPNTATWRSWDYHSTQKLPLACIWTGTSSVDWGTTGNWDSGTTPVTTDGVVIPNVTNAPLIGSGTSATCTDLTIENSGVLSILGDLTVNGTLTNNAGTSGLILNSTATEQGSLINSTANVDATVKRQITQYSSSTDGWHLLSSPVNNFTIASSDFEPTAGDDDLYAWDESTNTWLNYQVTGNNITNFVNGEGYLVAYKTTATKSFTGTLNNADVSFSGLSKDNYGWHLLGNPFPSALQWLNTVADWDTTHINATAKVWNESSASYTDITAGGVIPAMQGFMVQATAAGASLTIPLSARTHSSTSWYKDEETNKIKFTVYDTEGNTAQESIVRIAEGSTAGFDTQYDSHFLKGYAPQFYSVVGQEKLSTNTIPDVSAMETIPFDFIKNSSNAYYIEAEEIENLVPEQDVYLTDLKTNYTQKLNDNPVYYFTAQDGDAAQRFELHFSALGINQIYTVKQFNIYSNNNQIVVRANKPVDAVVNVYNVTGQLIAKAQLTGQSFKTIPLNGFAGIAIVSVVSSKGTQNQKVIIR